MRTDVETDNWLSRWKVRRLEKKKARPQAETLGLLVKENLEAFIFAVVLVVIVRHFALTPFRIPSSSMSSSSVRSTSRGCWACGCSATPW